MGERTSIGWTDSTVNFWHGCTKVGPGCDFCYAEQFSKRVSKVPIWGVGVPRRKIASAPALIAKLDRTRPGARVFVQSMSDIFDLEVPVEWFDEAWQLVHECDLLRIQIVTKRVTAIKKRLRAWSWPKHAGLIITVVDQQEADRDVPRALELKRRLGIPWLGLSIEPQLGPINLRSLPFTNGDPRHKQDALTGQALMYGKGVGGHPDLTLRMDDPFLSRVDWIISGGESKQGKDHQPRHYDLAWPRLLRDQCAEAGVAYFQKQLGARPVAPNWLPLVKMRDRQAGADPAEWPADLRVQQFPEALR